ncbi:hypothetical protein [Paraburkholderia sp. BR14374]
MLVDMGIDPREQEARQRAAADAMREAVPERIQTTRRKCWDMTATRSAT